MPDEIPTANPGRAGNHRCPTCNHAPLDKLTDELRQCPNCGQVCQRPAPGTPDAPAPSHSAI